MAKRPSLNRDELLRRLQAPAPTGSAAAAPHPAQIDHGPEAAEDHIWLDPQDVVLRGSYVRQHIDPAELEALTSAVREGGEVKQAIGVRVEGDPLNPVYVLVYGMRRWLASKAAGATRILARNHGRIPVAEALTLQVVENEARAELHPVDTAVSYALLVRDAGLRQADIVRRTGKTASYVSYMRAVGDAVLELTDEEREGLYRSSEATVQTFQQLAPLRVGERVAQLRDIAGRVGDTSPKEQGAGGAISSAAGSPRRRRTPFQGGPNRDGSGYSVRMSFHDDELREDPEGVLARAEAFARAQIAAVRQRVQALLVEKPSREDAESGLP